MHTFPQLRKIERKYGDKVVVVGVYSPKFPAERETANLREAVLRYRIEHPVVNDRDFQVWQRFGGRAWPTLIFVDPEGRIIDRHEGELPFEQFDPLVDRMLLDFEARGVLNPRASPIAVEGIAEPSHTLSFPDRKSTRLNSSHQIISYAVFCLKKKKKDQRHQRTAAPR